VTPVIIPTGLRAITQKGSVTRQQAILSITAGPHLIRDEWFGSHDMVLWPTSRSTPRWKSLSIKFIGRLQPPGSASAFWNGSVPAAMHLHLQIFHGHVFIYMTAIPAQSKAPTFITSSALFRLRMAAHVLLIYGRASGEILPYPERKSLTWTIVQRPDERNYRSFIFCYCPRTSRGRA